MSLYKGTKLVSGGTPKIPFATKDVAGLVKIGSGININEDGTISVDIPDVDMSVVSDAWDSSKVYAVGDYCIHNNVLYKCLVQNTGSEPTEGNSNWEKCSVGKELKRIDKTWKKLGEIQGIGVDNSISLNGIEWNELNVACHMSDNYKEGNVVGGIINNAYKNDQGIYMPCLFSYIASLSDFGTASIVADNEKIYIDAAFWVGKNFNTPTLVVYYR